MQLSFKLFFFVGIVVLVSFASNVVTPNGNVYFAEGVDEGERLYQASCLGCHSIGGGRGVGPDLMGITDLREREWILKAIKDPQGLVDSGDEIANELVKEYGMVMPAVDLSDAEVESIVNYLASASAPEGGASPSGGSTQQLTVNTFALYGFSGTLVLLLLMAIIWRGRLKQVRRNLD